MVKQNPPHGFGGGGEEVRTVPPGHLPVPYQPQVGLMHKCGCLEGMFGSFGRHALLGNGPQLCVDQREQAIGTLGAAHLLVEEKVGHIVGW